ncbi:MAG: hypothetical protein IPM07_19120 [Anaerolineales bacterium]|nr:hypothetical protein [Anaerolineales bacterium]
MGDETIGLSDVAMNAPTTISAFHRIFTMMIDFVAPPLSIRRQFLQLIQVAWSLGWREGGGVALERIHEAIVCYRRTGSLIIPPPPPRPFIRMQSGLPITNLRQRRLPHSARRLNNSPTNH